MAERSIATDCKSVALRATKVRIPPGAQKEKTLKRVFSFYLSSIYLLRYTKSSFSLNKSNMSYTYIEINKQALESNITELKKVIPGKTKFMAVIKANAYGHGFSEISDILKNNKNVDWFAVFEFSDAILLRKKTKKPILVLCTTEKKFWKEAIVNNISITLSRIDQFVDFVYFKNKNELKVHIKIDTGLGRQGFLLEDIERIKELLVSSKVKIEGIYTHFSGTESKVFDKYTDSQFKEIIEWKKEFSRIGVYPLVHMGATSGSLRNEKFAGDMARFGLGIYGLWPSEETQFFKKIKLNPVLSIKTTIVDLKKIPKGNHVAYDCTFTAKKDTTIAIIPVGYFDGLPRSLSNNGFVLLHNSYVPIIGRIMMNMCVIDVSTISKKVSIGDSVCIIGKEGKKEITADMCANWAQTINYEIVTRLNPGLERKIV